MIYWIFSMLCWIQIGYNSFLASSPNCFILLIGCFFALVDHQRLHCILYLNVAYERSFFSIILTKLPPCLCVWTSSSPSDSHRFGCFKTSHYRTELFRSSFLTFTVNEWSKIDYSIKNSDSYATLNKAFGFYKTCMK